MEQIGQQYRDTYAALTRNGANIGTPPTTIDGDIPLYPPEQAEYRAAQMEYLAKLFKEHPAIDERLSKVGTNKPQLLQARADILHDFVDDAANYAEAVMMKKIGGDEIRKRIISTASPEESDPRRLYPLEQYTPVGASR